MNRHTTDRDGYVNWKYMVETYINDNQRRERFWHYTLPRGIGVSSFLISLANEKVEEGSVLYIAQNHDSMMDVRNYLNNRVELTCPNYAFTALSGRTFDWVFMDNCIHSQHVNVFHSQQFLFSISKSKVLWIDTTEGK